MTEAQTDLSNDGCHVKTIFKGKTYTFNWTVEKLSTGNGKEESHISSSAESRVLCNTAETCFEVRHNLSIKNIAGTVILEKVTAQIYDNSSSVDVLPYCNTIMKKAREENVLILKCVMEFYAKDETDIFYYKPQLNPVSPLDGLSALSDELKVMHDKLSYADVSLRVGDDIVHVHKFILCARSPVFARMFETPMDESKENVIDITDVDPPVLKDLVSYLYTGVLSKDDFESVYALYYAADKYDVPSLRKACSSVLLSKLDVENACHVLALADRHSDVEFKNSVMDFIKFFSNKVLETESWKELVRDTRLAMEVVTLWLKNV